MLKPEPPDPAPTSSAHVQLPESYFKTWLSVVQSDPVTARFPTRNSTGPSRSAVPSTVSSPPTEASFVTSSVSGVRVPLTVASPVTATVVDVRVMLVAASRVIVPAAVLPVMFVAPVPHSIASPSFKSIPPLTVRPLLTSAPPSRDARPLTEIVSAKSAAPFASSAASIVTVSAPGVSPRVTLPVLKTSAKVAVPETPSVSPKETAPVALTVPSTSSIAVGAGCPIPTLPPVKIISEPEAVHPPAPAAPAVADTQTS